MNKNKTQLERKVPQVCYDIDHETIRALKNGEHDYCYLYSDYKDTVNYIRKYLDKHNKFSVAYNVKNDKYGEFEYAEFMPVRYYERIGEKDIEVKSQIYNINEIPDNLKCVSCLMLYRNIFKEGSIIKDYR